MTKIFIIAGEASGDALGSKLISALKKQHGDIELYGVGGDKMQAQGLESIFPMRELSLLGFMEIIPHIPKLLGRINQVADEVKRIKPDIVITIDAPLFNNRVAKKLQNYRHKTGTKLVHYVAPTVWAYKPKRAKKIAKLYDHLLVILPFEPPYFNEVGLDCTFVGHPVIEDNLVTGDGDNFRKKYNIATNKRIIYVMAGSRSGEIKRILPVFLEVMNNLNSEFSDLHFVFAATNRFKEHLIQNIKNSSEVTVISEKNDKLNAMAASELALAKSGTGSLEIALAKVAMVIAYRINPLSAFILRRMLKIEFVNLINIIQGKEVISELLQEDCTAKQISHELKTLLNDENKRKNQILLSQEALGKMGLGQEEKPSDKAAKLILKLAIKKLPNRNQTPKLSI